MSVVKSVLKLSLPSLVLLTGCRHVNKYFGTAPWRPPELTYCGRDAVEVGKTFYEREPGQPLRTLDGKQEILDAKGVLQKGNKITFLINHTRRMEMSNEDKKAVRNNIINEVSNAIRESSRQYTGAVYQHRAGFDTAADATLLGLTAATAVVGGAEVKAALGATATGVTGVRTSVQKNFFDDRSREAVFLVIAANQERAEKVLIEGKKASLSEYSLSDACNDLDRLYESGTVLKALNTIAGQNSGNDKAGPSTAANVTGTPSFSPKEGNLSEDSKVTISTTTAGATIYYTEDGTTPSNTSKRYTEPVLVRTGETIKAFAIASGLTDSSIASAAYTVGKPVATKPTFSPVQGTYTGAQAITIVSTIPGARIYYTINAKRPDTTDGKQLYTAPFVVSEDTIVHAVVVSFGYSDSAIETAGYIINAAKP